MLTLTTSKSSPGFSASTPSVAARLLRSAGTASDSRVDEREHDRACAEVVADLHRAAVLVGELDVERQHLVQVLIEPDIAELGRHLAAGMPG